MLADNNYNASALFWYTQRYHAEPRTEVRVPLASGARSDWGLLGVFRSFDRANRPWGRPAYRAVRLGPRALVHGRVNSVGGSFVLGRQTMRICVVRSANQLSTTRYSHSEPSKHIIRIQYFVTYVSEKNSPSKSTYLQHGDTHPVLKFSSIINLTAQCPSCGTNSYPVGVMLNVPLVSE